MKHHQWSFSAIKKFQTCPRQYHETKVLKNYVEGPTTATLYGTAFHDAAEQYIGAGEDLPPQFEFARNILNKLNALPGEKLCEYEMGLTVELEPCLIDAQDAWWRGIADLIVLNGDEARVVDYKTGANSKYAERGQLELMAMAVFKHFPQVKKVKAGLLFVVAGDLVKATYTREQEAPLWTKWLWEYRCLARAFDTGVWNPKESGLCNRHCCVESCEFNGKNRR